MKTLIFHRLKVVTAILTLSILILLTFWYSLLLKNSRLINKGI